MWRRASRCTRRIGGTGTLGLDITVRLHNMPGNVEYMKVRAYGDYDHQVDLPWHCPTADCVRTVHVDFPLDKLRYSGPHGFLFGVYAKNTDGHSQITSTNWALTIDNGKPPPPAGSTAAIVASEHERVGGASYYPAATNSDYARVFVKRDHLPWDPATATNRVKSGIWELDAYFQHADGFAYVDPQLHANPPSKGQVFYEASGTPNSHRRLSIDTTKLIDGVHKLLIGTCNTAPADGDSCGTLVLRFEVRNDTVRPTVTGLAVSRKGALSYTLSEPASVALALQRARVGRQAGGRCAAPSPANRGARRCTRFVPAGQFAQEGVAGRNAFAFPAGALKRGRYRVTVVATDKSKNVSRRHTAGFRSR